MVNAVVLIDSNVTSSQTLHAFAGTAVYDLGFGVFRAKPENIDLLLRKNTEELFVPLIVDVCTDSSWQKETITKLADKFPAARVITTAESEMIQTFDALKKEFRLCEGIEQSRTMLDVVRHAFEHLDDPDLSEDTIASHMRMTPAELHMHFMVAAKQSPTQVILQLRLQQARRLLWESDAKIHEVALLVGRDPKYFSDWFHKEVGINASEYRAAHRPPPPSAKAKTSKKGIQKKIKMSGRGVR